MNCNFEWKYWFEKIWMEIEWIMHGFEYNWIENWLNIENFECVLNEHWMLFERCIELQVENVDCLNIIGYVMLKLNECYWIWLIVY